MTANELRIGNWIEFCNKIEPKRYTKVSGRWLSVFDENNLSVSGYYDTIPLTPEILEKCGFTYSDLNGDSGYWQIKHPTAFGLVEILEGDDGFTYNYQTDITSLHQLQNLYFALTQTELTINL